MGMPKEPYKMVLVESFEPTIKSGFHGDVHIRPIAGQGFAPNLHVRCSKALSRDYPVGTRFRIKAKLTDREGGGQFLHSHHNWKFVVLDQPNSN